jgi:anti-sigma regulatory factor (Ser/Thr protein kinase)
MGSTRDFDKTISSLNEVFPFIKEFVDQEGIGSHVEYALNLVVEELFTNMVKYNSGSIEQISIGLERLTDRVVVRLVDFDVDPFDPSEVEEVRVDAPIEERHAGGLGLHLVKSIVDRISYEYNNRRMTVSVTKKLEQ